MLTRYCSFQAESRPLKNQINIFKYVNTYRHTLDHSAGEAKFIPTGSKVNQRCNKATGRRGIPGLNLLRHLTPSL